MDAFAGVDGFGGGDFDRGRWRGHPLRWAVGNYLRELLDDCFVFQFLILIKF